MSTRPQMAPYPVIVDGVMAGNISGRASIIQKLSMISYSFTWAGTTPVGSVSIQVSNDYSENPDGSVKFAGTWSALPLQYNGSPVTVVPVTGNSGNGFIDVDELSGYAIRPIYTATSGVGVLQCIINAKVS